MSEHFYLYIKILMVIIFYSCEQDVPIVKGVTTTIPKDANSLDIAEYIEHAEFIYPDSTLYLSYTEKLIAVDSLIFIKSYQRAPLFAIDRKGSLIKKFLPSGEGPLEYSTISDFSIGCSPHSLLISDYSINKIVEIDANSGEAIWEYNTGEYAPYKVVCFEDLIYFLTNDFAGGRIKQINKQANSISNEFVFGPPFVNNVMSRKPFYYASKGVYTGIHFSDTIYQITETGFQPSVRIGNKMGKHLDTTDLDFGKLINAIKSQNFDKEILEMNIPMGDQAAVGNVFFIPIISEGRSPTTLIYNHNNSESVRLKIDKIRYFNIFFRQYFNINHFDGTFAYSSFYLSDKFYEDAVKYIDNFDNGISENLSEFISKYPKDTELENPIIVKMKFSLKLQNFLN